MCCGPREEKEGKKQRKRKEEKKNREGKGIEKEKGNFSKPISSSTQRILREDPK